MKAIRFSGPGGPEVLTAEEVAPPAPGPGEILIRAGAIGVNFIDTYHRTGLYPVPLPSGLGLEAAGVVEAVGAGVTRFNPGDRAGYCSGPIGAYAEAHVVPEGRAVAIPAGVSDDIAAAAMLKGMTARYLVKATFPLKAGEVCVVHAAAGGVGQILTQWAKHIGATVIAVAGGADKLAIAKALGADHLIDAKAEPIAARVREITGGRGADVVYDSVGKDTFEASLDSLRPMGLLVSYGNASGPPPPLQLGVLSAKGSLFVTRPTLFNYTATTAMLDETAADLFGVLASGAVKVAQPAIYPLAEAAQAHRDLEGRKTTGSIVLRA